MAMTLLMGMVVAVAPAIVTIMGAMTMAAAQGDGGGKQ